MTKMLLVALFAAVAVATAVPSFERVDPHCPQWLAQAKAKVASAQAALTSAENHYNTVTSRLNGTVNADLATVAQKNAAFKAALTAYNEAENALNTATATRVSADARLAKQKTVCAQPVHPPNCAQLIKQAKTTDDNAKAAEATAKSSEAAAEAAKDSADTDREAAVTAYRQAVAALQAAVSQLSKGIATAKGAYSAAVNALSALTKKCTVVSAY